MRALICALLLLAVVPSGGAPRRAVIYVQPGSVPRERQARFCLEYCEACGYDIAGIAPASGTKDALALVTGGQADLVVTAFSPRSRPGDMRERAAAAGVRVEYVRTPVVRREVAELVGRLYRRYGDAHEVAERLGVTSQEIRLTMARMDELRNEAPPPSHRREGRRNDGF